MWDALGDVWSSCCQLGLLFVIVGEPVLETAKACISKKSFTEWNRFIAWMVVVWGLHLFWGDRGHCFAIRWLQRFQPSSCWQHVDISKQTPLPFTVKLSFTVIETLLTKPCSFPSFSGVDIWHHLFLGTALMKCEDKNDVYSSVREVKLALLYSKVTH